MLMFKAIQFKVCVLLLFIISFSCSTDDAVEASKAIKKDANPEYLEGIWSIYLVELDGQVGDVPVNYESCGRDFFIYNKNNIYSEFLFTESEQCLPNKNDLNWTLEEGVLTLRNEVTREFQSLEIVSLNSTTFVFRGYLDINADDIQEVYLFTAYRYQPPNELDIYTDSFYRKDEEPFNSHIEFGWDIYKGYNTFEKYEIWRSGEDCNINSAELIKTITDVNTNFFIDDAPEHTTAACYFLKVYTNKGLLGESEARYVNGEFIIPKNINLLSTSVLEETVSLSWEKYTGFYFSHYEIRVQDQDNNSSPRVESIAMIDNIDITTFIDQNPPYINYPIYSVYVHNIFGNMSPLGESKNKKESTFTRPEIINFKSIKFLSFDGDSQSFFFYGQHNDGDYGIIKYNYKNKEITAEAFKVPTTYTEVEMQLVTSEDGKELIFSQNSVLYVYNAENLTFKYSLKLGDVFEDSFAYLGNRLWAVSDDDAIYTFKRTAEKFDKIDEKPHFSEHQGSHNYEITKLDKNRLLLSHKNEGRAILYSIDNNGLLTNEGIKNVPLSAKYNSGITVNTNSSLLLDTERNTLYSTVSLNNRGSYTTPKVSFGFDVQGLNIFGTNNVLNAANRMDDFNKELVIYTIEGGAISNKTTKGYPLFVSEDSEGNLVSLSSGFVREHYYDTTSSDKSDLFVEIVNK